MSSRPLPREDAPDTHSPTESAAYDLGTVDSGIWALTTVAMHLGVHIDRAEITHEFALGTRTASSADILRIAKSVGLDARILTGQNLELLNALPRPLILRLHDGRFVVLDHRHEGVGDLLTPGAAGKRFLEPEKMAREWSGEVILLARTPDGENTQETTEFGLRWFIPTIYRYRRALLEVMLASFFLQIMLLIMPVFFQTVIDKVLVHGSYSTLTLVAIALVLIGFFDVTLQHLRTYAMVHTACRVDVELNRRVFNHLMKLPLSFFESNATGQIVARVREVETFRRILTGQAVTTVVDTVFTILCLTVLLLYSPSLTMFVIGAIPLYILIGIIARPHLLKRFQQRFQRDAESQQLLVETVVAAHAIKAAAAEPLLQTQWDEKRAGQSRASFHASVISDLAQNAVQYVSRLMTAALLFFGARAVIAAEISVGEFVAFNLLAMQVVGPIVRFSQLWSELQQLKIARLRLGDIMKTAPEVKRGALADLAPMRGAISFRDVWFHYEESAPAVLRDISLDIPAGQVLGVVGLSGSGKSTLTKLVQRLYLPQRGQVTIDGIDLSRVHPVWVRQQIGVVLQENILFSRTIHENIAFAAPYLTRDQVTALARMAGADEFIVKMRHGYDTRLEERGVNLSGGQRQRIAIARALARNPRVLILDEATSAVDYESERIIQTNLKEIVRDRTVIIIAHRLATVRICDRIIGMHEGRIVEDGTHDELLRIEGGLYRRLWGLQSESWKG